MAAPVLEATNTSTTATASTSHSIALPASIASGELLVVAVAGRQLFGSAPSGWTQAANIAHTSDADVMDIKVFTRTAVGTEGSTVSFTSTNSIETSHCSARISGASSIEFASQAEGSSGTPDPPSLSPSGGSDDYLWIVFGGMTGNRNITGAPTNYGTLLNPNTGSSLTDSHIGVAFRSLTASSEDPGTFSASNVEAWVAMTAAVAPASGPADPSGLTATLADVDQIDLAWTDNATTETAYLIERKPSGGSFSQIDSIAANSTSYSDTTVSRDTTYTYRVRCTDGSNNSGYSNEDSATTPPADPSAVTLSNQADTSIDVSFTDNTSGTYKHRVRYRETGTTGWNVHGTLPAGTTSTTVDALSAGTTYDIGVSAWNESENIESDIIYGAATTTGGSVPVTAPTGLEVTSSTSTSVSLSWTDTTSGAHLHKVYYRDPPTTGSWVEFTQKAPGETTATVTGLSPSTEYEFGVAAWDGVSTESSKATVTETTPAARWVTGVNWRGPEGRTVVEAEDGAIASDTAANDGSGAKVLPKGVQSTFVSHLDAVNFDDTYDSAPLVIAVSGGRSKQENSVWGTKAQVDAGTASGSAPTSYAPEPVFEVDAGGFTAYLYLRGEATLTAESTTFGAPTTLTAVGTTGTATPASGDLPAYDDRYHVTYSGELSTNKSGTASITLALEARLNGGVWSEIAAQSHVKSFSAGGGTHIFTGELAGTIADMDGVGTDQLRCRLKALTLAGSNPSASVTFGSVTWHSSNASYASMTPNTGDKVQALIIGSVSGG